MLYFVLKNKQEFSWHVGSGLPRLSNTELESIYADGHELEYLQRIGYAVDNSTGAVTLSGTRAINALRAMRLDASTNLSPPDPSPNGREMVGDAKLPEWHFNKLIKFWDLSIPEQSVYTAAYGAKFALSHNNENYCLEVARNALYSFWRNHGNPRNKFPANKAFRFADDDWGR